MASNTPHDTFRSSIHIHGRYFTQTAPFPPFDVRESLSFALTTLFSRLSSYDLTSVRFHGLFSGPTGIAYFLIKLRRVLQNDADEKGSSISKGFLPEIEKWIKILLEDIPRPATRVVHPSRGGIAHEMAAYSTVRAIWEDDVKLADKAVEIAAQAVSPENFNSNEWLYGRAGYLYLLRVLRSHFGSSSTSSLSSSSSSTDDDTVNKDLLSRIDTATTSLINTILSSPRPWRWHGMNGHGAVYGSAGIILQVYLSALSSCTTTYPKLIRDALSSSFSTTTKTIRDALLPDLTSLLSFQLPSGNWPACHERPSDRFVQVCHSAPGVVLTLKKLHMMGFFHQLPPEEEEGGGGGGGKTSDLVQRVNLAIKAGVECIIQRGMLTKVPSLCHGIAGNVLALMMAGEGREGDVGRFMGCMTEEVVNLGKEEEKEGGWFTEGEDDAMSLWTGPAGRVWCWVVYLMEGQGRDLIGYSDV